MSVRSTVILHIQQIARENRIDLPVLTDDLALEDSGLDSLALAILLVRLEETLGLDPFTESDDFFPHVVTLGDFVSFYESSAEPRHVDSGQAS
jgi:acyl carrier protein